MITGRPSYLPPDVAELYDWLAANGIDEWLPENPTVTVANGQITYTAFQFCGERGWDAKNIATHPGGAHTEQRTVPLVEPVTDRARFLATVAGLALIEKGRRGPECLINSAGWSTRGKG